MSDSHTLYLLIESIYKEIATTSSIKSSPDDSSADSNIFVSNRHQGSVQKNIQIEKRDDVDIGLKQINEPENLLITRNLVDDVHQSLLEELNTRKMSTNNWNQKITIELVECKIKLKQLVMEM